jgi:hypothetical protein
MGSNLHLEKDQLSGVDLIVGTIVLSVHFLAKRTDSYVSSVVRNIGIAMIFSIKIAEHICNFHLIGILVLEKASVNNCAALRDGKLYQIDLS